MMHRCVSSDEANAGRARLRPSRVRARLISLGAAQQELRPTELERVDMAMDKQLINNY
jgi:hypothetical protein